MCDTIVALPKVTATKTVLFGKNSDRDPDEPAEVVYIPRKEYKPGEMLNCTEISIPQASETAAILLVKPFQIWGAEMGANAYGVTVGNETIWTREKIQKENALTGMDLVRLAVERGHTAREALDVITELLAEYPQGGQGGYRADFFYHNSFLIADPREAWVLECPGKYWAAEKVKDIRTISNHVSISGKGDLCHPELVSHAVEKGWCKAEDFDFKTHYRAKWNIQQWGAKGKKRMEMSCGMLKESSGKITVEILMDVLRSHGPDKPGWRPDGNSSMNSLCVHASGFLVPTQTTSSMVSNLATPVQTHFVTASSSPCIALYKPIFMPAGIKRSYGGPTEGEYDPKSAWWHAELLKRLVELDYPTRLAAIKPERDELESKFIQEAESLVARDAPAGELQDAAIWMLDEAMEATTRWIEGVRKIPIKKAAKRGYRSYWKKYDKLDKIPMNQ